MSETHIVSSFSDDIAEIESEVLEMGKLVEDQLKNALLALKNEDRSIAKQVLRSDGRINELEASLNDNAIKVLALRQPVAIDLRFVVMSLKIARHLERVGDYAKNIARRTNTITKADAFIGSVDTMARMGDMVHAMILKAMNAYKNKDEALAHDLRSDDEAVDRMHNTLFRELLTYMMEDAGNVAGSIHLLLMAKNLERMGDHIADIAQETIYMVTGKWPDGRRAKGDKTSKMIVEIDEEF